MSCIVCLCFIMLLCHIILTSLRVMTLRLHHCCGLCIYWEKIQTYNQDCKRKWTIFMVRLSFHNALVLFFVRSFIHSFIHLVVPFYIHSLSYTPDSSFLLDNCSFLIWLKPYVHFVTFLFSNIALKERCTMCACANIALNM